MSFFSISRTLFKSMFAKPSTIKLGDLGSHFAARTRGHVGNDINACIFCGMCARRCPTHAIEVSKPGRSWAIERFNCIQCNCCVEICPVHCLSMSNSQIEPSPEKFTETLTADA